MAALDAEATARALRRALLALGAASIVATALELAMQRHWQSPVQVVPWLGLLALVVALALAARPSTRRRLGAARALAWAVAALAAFGVLEHVVANHDAGPLDYRYTDRWPTMSAAEQWWAAISKTVGPSPPLAPGALALAAALIVAATLGQRPAVR